MGYNLNTMKKKYTYIIWTLILNFTFISAIAPFFLICSIFLLILNKFYNRGPLFYHQIRLGLNGKPFKLYKFRTMNIDAEKNGPQWSSIDDPRITPLGKFLRKSRIDELPQIFNVLKFEINLIGPRAERPEMYDIIVKEISTFKERLMIKPGITGLAQVTSGYQNDIKSMNIKLKEDIYYIKHRSIKLDIKILYKTLISTIKLIGI